MTSSVTPWRTSDSPRPSKASDSVACDSMLTKPGATASPRASTMVLPMAQRTDLGDGVAVDGHVADERARRRVPS